MEFELKKFKEIKEKSKDGLRVYYIYNFKGLDASNNSGFPFKTEKKLDLTDGAVIDVPFSNKQTKVK